MNKKIIAVFATMMIALSLIGVSYALWYKWMFINGRVGTDDVDAVFTRFTNLDPYSTPGHIHYDPKPYWDPDTGEQLYWDKDVGYTNVTWGDATHETLNITLVNVYPCYYNDLEIEYQNTGSVPVKINGYRIIAQDFTLASGLLANDGEIYVEWANGVGSQLEPGDTAGSSLKIHIEQPPWETAQGATYHFTVEILLVQWNEYPYPGWP